MCAHTKGILAKQKRNSHRIFKSGLVSGSVFWYNNRTMCDSCRRYCMLLLRRNYNPVNQGEE